MRAKQSISRTHSYNVLDYKLGNNPKKNFLPTTKLAEELQQRTQILIDRTKKNIMQSYLKYKDYYDRKDKAAPPKENQIISFILQPKPDSQASKIHLDTIGGLVLFSFKKSCQTTILLCVALKSIIS